MLMDLAAGAPDEFEADVAIIGAGAAGITMARRLVAAGKAVILLESGGLDYEATTADLNAGSNVGEPYYDLDKARLRFFGGTTAIWGGRCAELDPVDLEQRPWVPHSGWPFGIRELRPFYKAAREQLGLPPSDPPGAEDIPLFEGLSKDELSVRCWLFDRQFDRFGLAANRALVNDPRLRVLIHATVREIVPAQSGRGVERLDVIGPAGQSAVVRAGTYVLAAGGLENPRLLLASNSVFAAGVGNEHDLVGRFFMEHPHARGGSITGASAWRMLRAFAKRRSGGVEYSPLLVPSPSLQEKLGVLNSAMTVASRRPVGGRPPLMKRAYLHAKHSTAPTRTGRGMWKLRRRIGRAVKQFTGPARPWWEYVRGRSELAIAIRAEQAPNPQSRVTLDREVDATGMPRIRLDWRLGRQDVDSVAALVETFATQAQVLGLGEVKPAAWLRDPARQWLFDDLISDHPIGGYHHMGTTRMAENPKLGVTDSHGRVHGLDNLFIAGSSLFPTSGWANPTLTILALRLRTADHILSTQRKSTA
jgi:choline dehydrogenase-like flavoprotein